MKKIAN